MSQLSTIQTNASSSQRLTCPNSRNHYSHILSSVSPTSTLIQIFSFQILYLNVFHIPLNMCNSASLIFLVLSFLNAHTHTHKQACTHARARIHTHTQYLNVFHIPLNMCTSASLIFLVWSFLNARTHTHKQACMHARTHARAHTHTHNRAHTLL